MNCPNCGEQINETQRFCHSCGINLEDKVVLFKHYKKKLKAEFMEHCEDVSGEKFGKGILGKAAWFIATNTKANQEYLQGDKMGAPESYDLLHNAIEQAKRIFYLLNALRNAYYNGDPVGYSFDSLIWICVSNGKANHGTENKK